MHAIDAGFPFRPKSVTGAILIQCGTKAAIAFPAVELRNDGMWHSCGTVVFRSASVLQIKYGHPNDEALRGHQLYEKGLKDLDIAEVQESDWIREVEETNSRAFPNSTRIFKDCRHHIFPFEETTLEVLWADFSFEMTDRSYEELGGELIAWANRYC